jgi:four helix bundle protein
VSTINRFEDIAAWQKGRELAGLVYEITNQADFLRDSTLRNQMRRAAISIIYSMRDS